MRQLYSHDQLYQQTRQLCEPHGWKVARGKCRGEESQGSLSIMKGMTAIALPYRLPMLMEAWEPHVISMMDDLDRRRDRRPVTVQESHA